MKRIVLTLMVAAGVAIILGIGAASGSPTSPAPSADIPGAGGSAGIARAQAAGVSIDFAAAAVMGQAPAGSCMNDPTARGCPRVRAVVASGNDPASASGTYGPSITEAASPRVAAGAAVASCLDKADAPVRGPRQPGGIYFLVYGKGYNTCPVNPQVQAMEVYANLQRLINGGWQNLAAGGSKRPGGGTITATGQYTKCNHQGVYVYRTDELAYAVVNGVGYTDSHRPTSNIKCG